MPIYEYRCEACGQQLEKLQKISDPVLVDCPACGEPSLRKLVSAAGFRLKGGGWYETDFKSDKRRNLVEGDKKSAENKGEGKSDKAAAEKSASDSKAGSKPASAATGSD